MPNNYRRIEESVDAQGFIIDGYSAWDCEKCGQEVRRYRGQSDIDCHNCGASYNASGQRLRDDWRNNPSVYDEEEISQLRKGDW
jgi:hypothetical protein